MPTPLFRLMLSHPKMNLAKNESYPKAKLMATIVANNTRTMKTEAVISKAEYDSTNWLIHYDH